MYPYRVTPYDIRMLGDREVPVTTQYLALGYPKGATFTETLQGTSGSVMTVFTVESRNIPLRVVWIRGKLVKGNVELSAT